MKKILVTGASGLVGSRFVELYSDKYNLLAPNHIDFDLTNLKSVSSFLDDSKPDAVINFAAFTDVSAAENQRGNREEDCWKLNVSGVQNLVDSLSSTKTHIIQISTDMVFPGSKNNPGPYKEVQTPSESSDEVTWYGFTKGEAERVVLKSSMESSILRIIYPVRAHYEQKLDFIRKPLSLYDQGKLYPLFTDQQISITFIDEICLALEKVIELRTLGTLHASSVDTTTPFELISYVLLKARNVENVVKQSSLDEFLKGVDSHVRYPKYGGLDPSWTSEKLGLKFSSWREIVEKLISQGLG